MGQPNNELRCNDALLGSFEVGMQRSSNDFLRQAPGRFDRQNARSNRLLAPGLSYQQRARLDRTRDARR
jgi:hypothetical protein